MLNNKSTSCRVGVNFFLAGKHLSVLGPVFCATLFAAGCSADVKRFDGPPFGLTETGSTSPNSSKPVSPVSNAGRTDSYDQGGYERPAAKTNGTVQHSELPDISRRSESTYANDSYSGGQQQPKKVAALTRGDSIEVRRGDTLYGISRRHGVALSDLMSVNGLTSSELRPGQVLYLPSGVAAREQSYEPDPAPTSEVSASSDWSGTYTVAQGDSLYAIARQHGVTISELQRNNGIDDPRRLRPGAVLRVPGYGTNSSAGFAGSGSDTYDAANARTPSSNVHSVKSTARRPLTTMSGNNVEVLNAPSETTVKTAALSKKQASSSDVVGDKLRWPARGQIIANFGRRADGSYNDGVNLAVPLGSDVHSAEGGVVAYAGSELRGYGKLVLIRHDNGWVTAYAHNDQMLVQRGDKVARGQIIAKAGKSGNVDRPQVHFELRQGSKPVDPMPYLEQL